MVLKIAEVKLEKTTASEVFSGPYFPAFRLNTERYSVSLHIHSECRKIQTKITSNTGTFHAVNGSEKIQKSAFVHFLRSEIYIVHSNEIEK